MQKHCPDTSCSYRLRAGKPAEFDDRASFCPHCGALLEDGASAPSREDGPVELVDVYSHNEAYRVSLVHSALESAGIEVLETGASRLYPGDAPHLYVSRANAEAARGVIELLNQPAPTYPPWNCPKCRRNNDGIFAICWKCGAAVDESTVLRSLPRRPGARQRRLRPPHPGGARGRKTH